jgi:hypothetical protein
VDSDKAFEIRKILNRKDRGMLCKDFLNALVENNVSILNDIYSHMTLHAFNLKAVIPVILEDYLIPYGLVEVTDNVVIVTSKGRMIYELLNSGKVGLNEILDVIESIDKKTSELENPLNTFNELLNEIKEIYRPRLFFDIKPFKPHLLEVVLRNSGRSPAYYINCSFVPDLPYGDGQLSDLSIFKNLSFLEQGQMIRFLYGSILSIINKNDYPKKSKVTINYVDSKRIQYSDSYTVDLEKYVGLLFSSSEGENIKDIQKELQEIRREIQKLVRNGIVIKSPKDIEIEQAKFNENCPS